VEFLQKFRILECKSLEMLTHVGCLDEVVYITLFSLLVFRRIIKYDIKAVTILSSICFLYHYN